MAEASALVCVEVVGRVRLEVAAVRAGCARCTVGCEEVSRARSSRMLLAASHPGNSNKPIMTVCLPRLLMIIPAYQMTRRRILSYAVWPEYGTPRARTSKRQLSDGSCSRPAFNDNSSQHFARHIHPEHACSMLQ